MGMNVEYRVKEAERRLRIYESNAAKLQSMLDAARDSGSATRVRDIRACLRIALDGAEDARREISTLSAARVERPMKSQWVVLLEDPEPFELRRLSTTLKPASEISSKVCYSAKSTCQTVTALVSAGTKSSSRPALMAVEKDVTDWVPVGRVAKLAERERLAVLNDLRDVQNGVCHVLIHAVSCPWRAARPVALVETLTDEEGLEWNIYELERIGQ